VNGFRLRHFEKERTNPMLNETLKTELAALDEDQIAAAESFLKERRHAIMTQRIANLPPFVKIVSVDTPNALPTEVSRAIAASRLWDGTHKLAS
jgi:hypothetical protein